MRRLIKHTSLTLLVILLAVSVADCRRKKKKAGTQEEDQGMASMVHVADPRTSAQLVRGFHTVEQNAWRWTMARFTVILRPPGTAAKKGATLLAKFSIPETIITHLKKLTLSTSVGNVELPPETYEKAGDYILTRDVPATAFTGDTITVDFSLDKALPPGEVDQRELGIVISSIGLEAK
ncbi:MAG: hypothetical protein NTY38_16575 [Acidobacteria bacterium]|nr:hypothetical protein [Acidobacteriota bacterium]